MSRINHNFIKYIICCFIILSITSSAYADDAIDIIKKIDKQMYQGTIKYKETISAPNKPNINQIAFYYNHNNYRKSIKNISSNIPNTIEKDSNVYLNDNDYFYVDNGNITYASNIKSDNFFSDVMPAPSPCYGRGLSALSNMTFDKATNTLYGTYTDGKKVTALLDPKLNYAAYEIQRILPSGRLFIISNSNPILVDGKYYIYKDSNMKIQHKGTLIQINISAATFKMPPSKDYIYDRKKPTNIVDSRKDGYVAFYKKGDVPSNISSKGLLKKTEEQTNDYLKRRAKINDAEKKMRYNKIISISLSLILVLIILFILIRQISNNKNVKKDNEKQ